MCIPRVIYRGARHVRHNLPIRILWVLILARKRVLGPNAHVVVLVEPFLIDIQRLPTIRRRVVGAVRHELVSRRGRVMSVVVAVEAQIRRIPGRLIHQIFERAEHGCFYERSKISNKEQF